MKRLEKKTSHAEPEELDLPIPPSISVHAGNSSSPSKSPFRQSRSPSRRSRSPSSPSRSPKKRFGSRNPESRSPKRTQSPDPRGSAQNRTPRATSGNSTAASPTSRSTSPAPFSTFNPRGGSEGNIRTPRSTPKVPSSGEHQSISKLSERIG